MKPAAPGRVSAGVPSGGQFAARAHPEGDVGVDDDPFANPDDLTWPAAGFDSEAEKQWFRAGAASPEAAASCVAAGLSPEEAGSAWHTETAPGEPPETITVARAVHLGLLDDAGIAAWRFAHRNRNSNEQTGR